ncbi:hypothetical protein P0082_11135 [Candidatus Haliotispira prima]|uniref:Uncharacterized protein n=1 Tax=Candidatus Haliotispira prima TaxID=3034016 RepID=A0ABY8MGC9_9SPIO|nr:hypothetical protein P0082_11135 [Candidatus Haliotispira prima]
MGLLGPAPALHFGWDISGWTVKLSAAGPPGLSFGGGMSPSHKPPQFRQYTVRKSGTARGLKSAPLAKVSK